MSSFRSFSLLIVVVVAAPAVVSVVVMRLINFRWYFDWLVTKWLWPCSQFSALKPQSGRVTVLDLPPLLAKLKGINGLYSEKEIKAALEETYPDVTHEIDFESFLTVSFVYVISSAEFSRWKLAMLSIWIFLLGCCVWAICEMIQWLFLCLLCWVDELQVIKMWGAKLSWVFMSLGRNILAFKAELVVKVLVINEHLLSSDNQLLPTSMSLVNRRSNHMLHILTIIWRRILLWRTFYL